MPGVFRPKRIGVVPSRSMLGALIGSAASPVPPAPGPFDAWSHYFDVTIDKTKVPSAGTYTFPISFTIPAGPTLATDIPDIRLYDVAEEEEILYAWGETNYSNKDESARRCDLFVTTTLSDSVDKVVRVYVGNAEASQPDAYSWPTGWKRSFFRRAFAKDMASGVVLSNVGSPTFSSDGVTVSNGVAVYEADSADWIATSGSILIAYKPTTGNAASQTLISQRFAGNNALIGILSGTDLQANEWVGGVEQWTAAATIAWGSGVLDMMQVVGDADRVDILFNGVSVGNDTSVGDFLSDLAAPINYGRNGAGTNYADGTIAAVIYLQNVKLTADQSLLLDRAITDPATFQSVGTLQENS